jgi:hypothetical protein
MASTPQAAPKRCGGDTHGANRAGCGCYNAWLARYGACAMRLRIRGNSLRLEISKTDLAKLVDAGKAEDVVRFSSEQSLRYAIEVRPTGAITAQYDKTSIVVTLPKSRLDLWARPEEVSVEGSQPIGGGKVLQIVLEKDETHSS